MTNDELWQAVLGEIELSISRANFITWFKNTSIVSSDNGVIIIGVPNGFAKEWLENKYNTYIIKALRSFNQDVKEIKCIINISNSQDFGLNKVKNVDAVKGPLISRNYAQNITKEGKFYSQPDQIGKENNLNNRYQFENFIVGENNELARAACYAVSQNLGKAYNPLFIYGGVGLGKTHLLQSIGNEIIKKDPKKRVLYITAERFAGELVDSIKNQKVSQFKDYYQNIDLLIIDDVQFLSGKEKTQHEFFHIFNALYQLNKQIVLSSDRLPKAIPTLEERLRSRFEGGMIADVGAPDLETRMAILRSKSAEKDISLEDAVIRFIAENVKNNIRELEGALNKVIACSELEGKNPSPEIARKALSEFISSGKRKGVHAQYIIEIVANFYNISIPEIIEKGRRKEVALARQVAMYLIRNELNASYPSVGEKFGGRDHTTALHAHEKISRELENDEKLKETIIAIKEKIYSV